MSKEHLVEAVNKLGLNRRGVVTARRVARYADGLSESGGESKARALMIERGWQTPELQIELFDPVEPGRPATRRARPTRHWRQERHRQQQLLQQVAQTESPRVGR